MEHPSGIPQKIVNKVVARRGRLHAFESLDPETTALVVIDLDDVSVENDPASQAMIATVNSLAAAVRASGGVVAWVLSRMDVMPKHFSRHSRRGAGRRNTSTTVTTAAAGRGCGPGWRRCPATSGRPSRAPARSFPASATCKPQLDARGIDTVLIAGLVTNICCESSARDAAELEYKVILVSDALSGQAHGLHEATLATFYRIFGDVRPSAEVAGLLQQDTRSPRVCKPVRGIVNEQAVSGRLRRGDSPHRDGDRA